MNTNIQTFWGNLQHKNAKMGGILYTRPTFARKRRNNYCVGLPETFKKYGSGPAMQKRELFTDHEAALVNGYWQSANKKSKLVPKMHNILSTDGMFHLADNREFVNSSPKGSDSGIEADFVEAGSLSWLLNYKLPELPPMPDTNGLETEEVQLNNENLLYIRDNTCTQYECSTPNKTCVREDGSNRLARYSGPKKPPFTYTELIEHALNEKGELTVSGIYHWISEHFPFYRQNDDRWKNSVRHNLSINPHFRKGGKAVHGAGHLWTIAQKDDRKAFQIKQRVQSFLEVCRNQEDQEQKALDMELQVATASILEPFDENNDDSGNVLEVEYVNLVHNPGDMADFLFPPVPKQQLMQECGLLGNDYLITDLNPHTLGLNMSETEVDTFYDYPNMVDY